MEHELQSGSPIGVCLSGGGYRAAAFHLGTMSYLDRLNLAVDIDAISTVSGGTFTGAKYVLSLAEKQSFPDFFKEYFQLLIDTDLVSKGLKELASRKNQVTSGRQDLIVSIAQVYSETLFCKENADGKTEPYYFDVVLEGEQPITNVIFNATDFRTGVAFRFQSSENGRAKIGNNYNNISAEDAGNIRLADIVAASSCFPGGFEPLSFPYDFSWKNRVIPDSVKRAFPFHRDDKQSAHPEGPVPLMDGGVFDNQGLESLLLARDLSEKDLSLIVVSDVDQASLDLYNMPKPQSSGGLTLLTMRNLTVAFLLSCLMTLVTLSVYAWLDWQDHTLPLEKLIFLYLIPFVLTSVAVGSIIYVRSVLKDDISTHLPLEGDRAWNLLRHLTIGQVRNMVKLRINSLLTLTSSVFMSRIRRLVYRLVYSEHGAANKTNLVANLIYSLSPSKTAKVKIKGIAQPSELLSKVACVAFNTPTKLWFDERYQAPCLVASGQASLCFNMIKLHSRRYKDSPDNYTGTVLADWNKLKSDWEKFNSNPFFLLEKTTEEDWSKCLTKAQVTSCDWKMFTVKKGVSNTEIDELDELAVVEG